MHSASSNSRFVRSRRASKKVKQLSQLFPHCVRAACEIRFASVQEIWQSARNLCLSPRTQPTLQSIFRNEITGLSLFRRPARTRQVRPYRHSCRACRACYFGIFEPIACLTGLGFARVLAQVVVLIQWREIKAGLFHLSILNARITNYVRNDEKLICVSLTN